MHYSDMLPDEHKQAVEDIGSAISCASRVFITSHVRPDGDAIGSISGLAKALTQKGIDVSIAMADPLPARFSSVFDGLEYSQKQMVVNEYDLVFILDSGESTRTGIDLTPPSYGESGKIINIDHHASNTLFGELNYVDINASSTCEMITALLNHLQLPLDSNVASGLMLGLFTDSRFFQNENLRYTAHLCAAKLLHTGLDTRPLLKNLNSSRTETDLRMQGFCLSNFKLHNNGKIATLTIKKSDLDNLNAKTSNIFASGIFNILTSMRTTIASVVTFEGDNGLSFCEFRAREGFNVKEVAVKLGGGGHIAASGCSQNTDVDLLAKKSLELMTMQLNKYMEA